MIRRALMKIGKDIILKDDNFSNRFIGQQDKKKSLGISLNLHCLAGALNIEDSEQFYRLIFRASKGNAMIRSERISDDLLKLQENKFLQEGILDIKTFQKTEKVGFMIFFAGGIHDQMKKKIIRICEIFSVQLHELPKDAQNYEFLENQFETELKSINQTLKATKIELFNNYSFFSEIKKPNNLVVDNEYTDYLVSFDDVYNNGYCSYIEELRLYLIREKAIYFYMNFFKNKGNVYEAQFWCPKTDLQELEDTINKVGNQNQCHFYFYQNQDQELYEPPSLIKTNDFTWAFQEVVNTYGPPRYGEINPGLMTIITFPFLFGIMFGDIGHGTLLFLFGSILVIFGENIVKSTLYKNRSEDLECKDIKFMYKARYMFLFMGMFAAYCGFIYNDCFSLSLNYSQSCYNQDPCEVIPQLGMDAVWNISKNRLMMMNSLKMKLSIVIGVFHMIIGIFLKGLNSIHYGKYLDFFFEFVPQLVFMSSTFGYMSFLIIIKWMTHFENKAEAPSVIGILLTMAFKSGDINGKPLYPNQVQVQKTLILLALVSVPLMLIPKPFIKVIKHKLSRRRRVAPNHHELIDEHLEVGELGQDDHDPLEQQKKNAGSLVESRELKEEKHFQVDEIVIEQCIEAIEFILGSVSNTASYLRLWALSLAHSQLSEVFFDKTIAMFITSGSIIGIIVSFVIFASVTFMVLMCMDSLECILHAVRLHWVEFQNKFYKADGYTFECFNFREILEQKVVYTSRM